MYIHMDINSTEPFLVTKILRKWVAFTVLSYSSFHLFFCSQIDSYLFMQTVPASCSFTSGDMFVINLIKQLWGTFVHLQHFFPHYTGLPKQPRQWLAEIRALYVVFHNQCDRKHSY